MKEKNWRTYVLLDEESKNILEKMASSVNKSDWELHGEHFTVVYGRRYEELGLNVPLGSLISISITHIGGNEFCYAVKAHGFYSHHPVSHITLLVNKLNGGKPVMSNTITEWKELNCPVFLTGTLIEYEK